MSSIKVGFSRSSGLISRAIRFFTKSRVSHAFLLIEDSFLGNDMVMEATKEGFHLVPFSVFAKHKTVVSLISLGSSVDVGVKKASDWLGRRYDYLGVLGTLVVLLGRWMNLKWANPLNTKAMFCSEVIVFILQNSNYPGSDSLDPSSTTPEDLFKFLQKSRA